MRLELSGMARVPVASTGAKSRPAHRDCPGLDQEHGYARTVEAHHLLAANNPVWDSCQLKHTRPCTPKGVDAVEKSHLIHERLPPNWKTPQGFSRAVASAKIHCR